MLVVVASVASAFLIEKITGQNLLWTFGFLTYPITNYILNREKKINP